MLNKDAVNSTPALAETILRFNINSVIFSPWFQSIIEDTSE